MITKDVVSALQKKYPYASIKTLSDMVVCEMQIEEAAILNERRKYTPKSEKFISKQINKLPLEDIARIVGVTESGLTNHLTKMRQRRIVVPYLKKAV